MVFDSTHSDMGAVDGYYSTQYLQFVLGTRPSYLTDLLSLRLGRAVRARTCEKLIRLGA